MKVVILLILIAGALPAQDAEKKPAGKAIPCPIPRFSDELEPYAVHPSAFKKTVDEIFEATKSPGDLPPERATKRRLLDGKGEAADRHLHRAGDLAAPVRQAFLMD